LGDLSGKMLYSMRRKLYLETFGCQMNVLDSELVLGQLRAQGYTSVDDRDQADVILYNTCSVREHAEQKVWSRLGELRPRKAEDPGLIIGVIGCMAERDGVNIFQKFPHVSAGRASWTGFHRWSTTPPSRRARGARGRRR
jgi:tRNA-2-methylthio-N6-dimethylallyladenosine synthase